MTAMRNCTEEEASVDGGCKRSDPLLKLFGRSIPVRLATESTADTSMWSDGKIATIDNLITSPAERSLSSHCHQDTTGDAPQFEDDCNGISAPEELGSCSGSSDVFDEEKSNLECGGDAENSGEAAVVAVLVPEAVAEDSEIDEDKREEESNNEHASQDQLPKKPEKLLPCPRCESLDTKFCYFNNYNVNQPRHFCKNCQRYWTAGGILRNVPVGAGRRKNKHSVSHRRHGLADGIAEGGDTPDSVQQLLSCSISHADVLNKQVLQLDACSFASVDSPSSSTILSFGKESPFRDSFASASLLNLHHPAVRQGKAKVTSGIQDAKVGSSWQTDAENKPMLKKCVEAQNAGEMANETDASESWQPGDDSTCGSSVTAQLPMHKAAGTMEQKVNTGNACEPLSSTELVPGYTNGVPFPFFSGPWQHGYHVNWNNGEATSTLSPSGRIDCNGHGTNLAGATASPVSPPAWTVAPQGIWTCLPWPLICSPLWNLPWGDACSALWGPTAAAGVAATGNPGVLSSLGKHPREGSQLEGRKEGSLWVPKTLRIDDPGEAAKSSIWRTLGLTNRPE